MSGELEDLLRKYEPVLRRFGSIDNQEDVLKVAYGMIQREVAAEIRDHMLAPEWVQPSEDDLVTLAELMQQEDQEVKWHIDGFLGEGFNHVITAQYKTGKSLLAMNIAGALVDGYDFMGEFRTNTLTEKRVGIWNAEMMKSSFRSYISRLKIQRGDMIATAHFRGLSVDILGDVNARDWTIDWLGRNEVDVWVIDTWGRLCAWSKVSENKNDEVGALLQAVDEIKRAAGVSTTIITAHTGRSDQGEGSERIRGATVVDDWTDVRYLYVKTNRVNGVSPRFLHGEGREVNLDEFEVGIDEATGRLIKKGSANRKQARINDAADEVAKIVMSSPGISGSELRTAITKVGDANAKTAAMNLALEKNLVRREGGGGIGKKVTWFPVSELPTWAKTPGAHS